VWNSITLLLSLPPCSSLAFQPPDELAKTLEVVKRAGVTVVSLPLVNQWTQDRSHEGGRTPRWRGITLLHELRQVRPVCCAVICCGGAVWSGMGRND